MLEQIVAVHHPTKVEKEVAEVETDLQGLSLLITE
jgi:hypothetical protein